MPDTDAVCEKAIADVSALDVGFEDLAEYNRIIGFTHKRTVADVAATSGVKAVLEIGFFTGAVSLALARLGYQVTASDIPFVANEPTLRGYLEGEGITVVPWDLSDQHAPFDDSSFDMIVFTEVIEHLPFNCIPLLRELSRILKPQGVVYCATPNLASLNHRVRLARGRDIGMSAEMLTVGLEPDSGASLGFHWREHTKDSLIGLFEASGFDCVEHRFVTMNPVKGAFPKSLIKAALFSAVPSFLGGQVGMFRPRQ